MQNGDFASGYVGKTTLFGLALGIRRERRMTVLDGTGRGGSLRHFGICDDIVELSVVSVDDSFIADDENDMPIV